MDAAATGAGGREDERAFHHRRTLREEENDRVVALSSEYRDCGGGGGGGGDGDVASVQRGDGTNEEGDDEISRRANCRSSRTSSVTTTFEIGRVDARGGGGEGFVSTSNSDSIAANDHRREQLPRQHRRTPHTEVVGKARAEEGGGMMAMREDRVDRADANTAAPPAAASDGAETTTTTTTEEFEDDRVVQANGTSMTRGSPQYAGTCTTKGVRKRDTATATPARKSNPVGNGYDHVLIQSPLRKHIKAVHDSACGNATCTATKDPFPLRLPDHPFTTAGKSRGGARPVDGGAHLAFLGASAGMTGTGATLSTSPRDGVGGSDEDGREERRRKRGGNDEATDLLSSAAFLFKHSRRNLF